jgi:hypothetical protein
MTRTQRIWQRKLHPERLPYYIHYEVKPYASDKRKLSCINKIRKIRNRWWRTGRHYNNMLCKKSAQQLISDIDEYFGSRYRKPSYTEFFD